MDQGEHWRDAYGHGQPASHAQKQQLPPPPAALASSSSGGISPADFLTYVSIGFGCTIGLIAVGVALWLLTRRALGQRRDRQTAATVVAGENEPRRAQAEAVQRMVEDKRRAAAAARKPFLVVHPGGDAMVAFKDSSKAAAPAPAPHEELIKSYLGSDTAGHGSGGTISLTAVAAGTGAPGLHAQQAGAQGAQQAPQQELAQLMSRRALVAAAALSGRTSSGLADMLAAYSPTAEAAAAAAGTGGPFAENSQQQQQQERPLHGASNVSGHQALLPSPPSSGHTLLAAPPSAYSRTSSGASSAQEDLALLRGRGSGAGSQRCGNDENV